MRSVMAACAFHLRGFWTSARSLIGFPLALVMSFLLTDKAVGYAREIDEPLQMLEPFVWAFGDGGALILSSLLLTWLIADLPRTDAAVPALLYRVGRRRWALGQTLYVLCVSAVYVSFVGIATVSICARFAFAGDQWSGVAARLGYSGLGLTMMLPASVRVMEQSTPCLCALHIFWLSACYALSSALISLNVSLLRGRAAGLMAAFAYAAYGALLNPRWLQGALGLPDALRYRANILFGWISPLNHATYAMHAFGRDHLPELWQSYLFFGLLIALMLALSVRAMRRFAFSFGGRDDG